MRCFGEEIHAIFCGLYVVEELQSIDEAPSVGVVKKNLPFVDASIEQVVEFHACSVTYRPRRSIGCDVHSAFLVFSVRWADMARVAINGFGRIGRGFTRAAYGRSEIEIVAINDLAPADNLAYLLKYDTVYGRAKFSVSSADKTLVIDSVNIPVYSEKDPTKLPWKDMQVDIVV